ncbi:glycoside hydrolase family 128 protein [Lentinula edodes]|uniref:Glycoside hydrolase family 128 protein n=1 Tax=Lentinula edodes TaxID=5353 RepID=A0A1Q3DZ02_LENED|nr:glycoside hydrolase family 128 protein [Lentinula edodes]
MIRALAYPVTMVNSIHFWFLLSSERLGVGGRILIGRLEKQGLKAVKRKMDRDRNVYLGVFTKSVISWQYDWGLTPPTNLAQSGIEYVPMQWGSGGIENLSAAVKAQGTNVLLTFNEPDFNQQSNIDPNTAAQLWIQYIEPLRTDIPGIKIGAPAVSSGGTGFPWLTTFFSACGNCSFDFLPIHWYGEGTGGFYDYLYQMYGEFGNKTIWVTEYADTSLNDTEVMDFINQTTVFMDGLDFVERYAWFGYFRPENGSAYNMLNNNGSLNDLGQFYIGADTVETSGPATNTAAGVPAAGGPTQTLATVSVAAGHAPTFIPNNAWSNHKGWQREPSSFKSYCTD